MRSAKTDLAWRRIVHVDAEALQLTENCSRHWPILAELLVILPLPLSPDFVRKARGKIQIGTGKIQHPRRHYDCHFQRQQFIIGIKQERDFEAANLRHAQFIQPLINISFAQPGFACVMNFERGQAQFCIAFDGVNDTVNPKAKPSDQPQPMAGA